MEVEQSGDVLRAACSHDGYTRLNGAPVHRREIESRRNALQVSDTISGRGVHSAAAYFHFHPGVRLEEVEGDWRIHLPHGNRLRLVGQHGLRLKREEGEYAPEFGKSITRPVLVWRIEQRLPVTAGIRIFEEPVR
jgi:hypothetical protein